MSTAGPSIESTPATPPAVSAEPLTATMQDVLGECPRFRILVAGKSGVGKSSLINRAFGVETANVAHDTPGVSSIEREIYSPSNSRFVLHDSLGYEHGESQNMQILKKFIKDRCSQRSVADRLHAIWLCIEIPHAGGRVLQFGDEELFRLARGQVPMIVVFTQFDNLVRSKERKLSNLNPNMNETELSTRAEKKARKCFRRDCVKPMEAKGANPIVRVSVKAGYESTLNALIKLTIELVDPSLASQNRLSFISRIFTSVRRAVGINNTASSAEADSNPVGIVLATAQRIDLDSNIAASISIGKRRYWQSLRSGTRFLGRDIKVCLNVIHEDMILVWNFKDAETYLLSDEVKTMVLDIIGYSEPLDCSPSSTVLDNTKHVAGVASAITGLVAANSHPLFYITVPITVGVVLAKWGYDVYKTIPGILKLFMGYIVDLTIIMQILFAKSLAAENMALSASDVREVLGKCKNVETKDGAKILEVHREIRNFVEHMGTWTAVAHQDHVLGKILELIKDNHPSND